MSMEAHWSTPRMADLCRDLGVSHHYRTRNQWVKLGLAKPLPGFQLRYMSFRDQAVRDRLIARILPNSAIEDAGARMVRGDAK